MSSLRIVLLLLAVWAMPISGQEGRGRTELAPFASTLSRLHGARVRITSQTGPSESAEVIVGTLVSSDARSLVIRRDASSAPVTVALESVTIEEWHRYDPKARAGVIGLILGALAGGVVGHAINDPPPPQTGCRPQSDDLGTSFARWRQ
jgi:hypothetical protein